MTTLTTRSLSAAIADAAQRLAAAGVDSPRHDAEELAAHLLGVRRGELRTRDTIDLPSYEALVDRRALREPLQHLTGVAGFRYLDLLVGPGALVPRPETELVAGEAIAFARAVEGHRPLIVDLGTGSGAIALAVASEVPGSVVHAVEPDPAALAWASRNADATGHVIHLHLVSAADALPALDGTVDVVVSNPPYLPDGSWVADEVRHDPALALWGGPDGLDVVREVVMAGERLLRPGGALVVEHGERHSAEVRSLLAAARGWTDALTHRDLTGRDRFVTARRTR
ncbi:peptide chain release factor N(5)-glutamine methyltransferase [Acidothermaceae bacterium B102]|nr:peptide chain release factor N(5)-glutamine methyltransferase [Acidothermaceae bacterium B102]